MFQFDNQLQTSVEVHHQGKLRRSKHYVLLPAEQSPWEMDRSMRATLLPVQFPSLEGNLSMSAIKIQDLSPAIHPLSQ